VADARPGADTGTVITPALLREWPLPDPSGNKNAKGRILVVGGGTQTPGAVLLAAEAALRVGAGKLQVATVRTTAPILSTAVPEGFVQGLPTRDDGDIDASAAEQVVELAAGADAVLLGPGIQGPEAATALLERVVPHLRTRLVVDALGMAFVTRHRDGVRHLADRTVLTPNSGELARTLEVDPDEVDEDLLRATCALSEQTGATVVSGAAASYVVEPPGTAWRNDAGGPGMAASGSGDVKAGTVAGLMARGATPAQAGVWGCYLHGRAGERLTSAVGRVGFLARELLPQLPRAMAEVEV
jgi:hydroxyethylthiazole kinase-like uncharacterized protein yjeF